MILVSDIHLSDKPEDEYRWSVFDHIYRTAKEHNDFTISILGDVTEKKDKHSSALVNRFVKQLKPPKKLQPWYWHILCGNHDQPLKGPAFWEFLNEMDNVRFYSTPFLSLDGVMFLPHSTNPSGSWTDYLAAQILNIDCLLLHQTVDGVIGDNGHRLSVVDFPKLPNVPTYSGDIHRPQKVGNVVYVGSPHPVDYGDDYAHRLLVLDNKTFQVKEEIPLFPPRKAIVAAHNLDELQGADLKTGDMVRIRYTMPSGQAEIWPAIEQDVRAWAEGKGIVVASLEAVLEMGERKEVDAPASDAFIDPKDVLLAFAEAEGLDAEMLAVGMELLRDE